MFYFVDLSFDFLSTSCLVLSMWFGGVCFRHREPTLDIVTNKWSETVENSMRYDCLVSSLAWEGAKSTRGWGRVGAGGRKRGGGWGWGKLERKRKTLHSPPIPHPLVDFVPLARGTEDETIVSRRVFGRFGPFFR